MDADKRVRIITAAHKKYRMPTDEMYLPVHVGADSKTDENGKPFDFGYVKDNTGDNISKLNPGFCELTGLYWAWKNVDSDYIGLVHYRRHFCFKTAKDPFDAILTYEELKPFLGKIKVFVPKKRHYYIETLYSHYKHAHYSVHLDVTRQIINEKYPQYLKSYDKAVNCRSGYMFNMMIMEKDLMDQYCSWLFDILFELYKRIDMSELNEFQGRYLGRVGEIIFNAWLNYQTDSGKILKTEVLEIPYIYMEKINWRKKITAFLMAKFVGKKYEKSF